MVLETHMKLCATEPDFPEKNFVSQKLGKWTKNGSTTLSFEFIGKLCHYFLRNLFYIKIYIICYVPAQIPYLGKF